MLVRAKDTSDSTVAKETSARTKLAPVLDSLPLRRYPSSSKKPFSVQWFPDTVGNRAVDFEPDVINLHWICNGFLRIETLRRFTQPVVWTLHDMWPFSGGCHYAGECDRYKSQCGQCPQLSSTRQGDLSASILHRKQTAWKDTDLTIVTPSKWLGKCAKESSLFQDRRIEVIPNGVDTDAFKPIDRELARQILNLPPTQKIVLFCAGSSTGDPRKGFSLLTDALETLETQKQERVSLAVLGANSPSAESQSWKFETHYIGKLRDEISLALVYCAADIFVAPSRQDNLPNTILEALACGIPCVSFNIGGIPDMIDHRKNGYLAEPFKTSELAKGIKWILEDESRYQELSAAARSTVVENFSIEIQAERYNMLYESLLK